MNTPNLTEEYASGNRNFQGRHLSGSNLGWANLTEADFRNADFYGANLSGASLKQADLSGKTNLAFADLSRADLTAVDLRGANLEGANLAGTVLDHAIYDEHTIFPRGFDPDTAGAITDKVKLEALLLEKRAFTADISSSSESNPASDSPAEIVSSEASNLFSNSTTWVTSIASPSAIDQATSISEDTITPSEIRPVKNSAKPWLISLGIGIPVIGLMLIPRSFNSSPEIGASPTLSNSGHREAPRSTVIGDSSETKDNEHLTHPLSQSSTQSSAENVTPQFSRQEALQLVNRWMQAKRTIFGPSYDTELVSKLTTRNIYEEVLGTNGSLAELRQNNAFYRYGQQNVTPLGFSLVNQQQATIDVSISEELSSYESNELQKTWTNSQDYRYTLTLDGGQWKLSEREKIDDKMRGTD
jgi:hypothetical protein